MQLVVSAAAKAGRRRSKGVKRPSEALSREIARILQREPGIPKAKLARELGVTRVTVSRYLHTMQVDVAKAAARDAAVRQRVEMSHVDLVERVASAADEVRSVIGRLRKAQVPQPGKASAVFRGYASLTQLYRLLGELLGQVQPATTNVYLTKVEALLATPASVSALPPAVRAAMGIAADHG